MNRGYYATHYLIYNWVETGLLKFEGIRSTDEYTELDEYIFKSFGFATTRHPSYMCEDFNRSIESGNLNIDWLFGEHGLTLYKILLIRKGML